jgi:hypothetical protein
VDSSDNRCAADQGQFSQFGLQPAAGRRSVAATKPATQAPVACPDVDPPTSGDRLFHATLGRITAGVSPASLGLAYADLAFHFAVSPGKWQQLLERAVSSGVGLTTYARTDLERPLSALYRAERNGAARRCGMAWLARARNRCELSPWRVDAACHIGAILPFAGASNRSCPAFVEAPRR